MTTMGPENKETSSLNTSSLSSQGRGEFLFNNGNEIPERNHCPLNYSDVNDRTTPNQNSEKELLTQKDDAFDDLMSELIECQVEMVQFERDLHSDVWSLFQQELDYLDISRRKWITEMEVMFTVFVHDAVGIVQNVIKDQRSLAEHIEYMLEDACTDLYSFLSHDIIQLENDVIDNLTISDGLVALAVRSVSRELDALTSSHDAICNEVVAIELACENTEFEVCRRGFLEKFVTEAVGCVIQHKADQERQRRYKATQPVSKTDLFKPTLSVKTSAVQPTSEVNPIDMKPQKPEKDSPLRRLVTTFASIQMRRIISCIEWR